MFAQKQILTTSLIAVGLTATIAFQANAQNQINLNQVPLAQQQLLSAQASPVYGFGTAQLSGGQYGYQQVSGAPLVAGYALNGGLNGGQAVRPGYSFGAAAPVAVAPTALTGVGFAGNSAVTGAVTGSAATNTAFVNGGSYQVAAPAVTSYGYAVQQPAYATRYTQQYVQAAPRVAYTQYRVAQPTIRYAYAQPAVRYGYVQQAAQQQQVATGGAAYYQSYSAAIRPTLPKPTVTTQTYTTGGSASAATTQTAAYGKQNVVPYENCVAGCEEACSQNKSFLSHCVKACGDLVKVIGQNQSYAVDWKSAGSQAGRAVIAAHGQ